MADRTHDIIVIGAGLSGIIAAQRYLDAHPDGQILVLEKDEDIGGVFSRRRLYDSFWTQWSIGLSEFADLPMKPPPEEDSHYGFYKAKYTTQYLEEYVNRKGVDGRTLRERMIFNTAVQSIEKKEDIWVISCTTTDEIKEKFFARKLMVASGLTSSPEMPNLRGIDRFGGPVIHSEQFGQANIIASQDIKKIMVIGAGKSSADMVYEAVKHGKEVSWVIRTSGTGAGFFASGKGKWPFKSAFELASTRAVASTNPSIFNSKNAWTNFLHRSSVGLSLLQKLLASVDTDTRKLANYKGRKSDRGFEKLEYNAPFFWQNGAGGLLHHEDFWDLIAENVYVYRDEIKSLDKNLVRLEGGLDIQCDAILCGTGWYPSIEFFDNDLLIRLGLPHKEADDPKEEAEKWSKLLQEADKEICDSFPMLANPPPHPVKKINLTPYRLYQGVAPIHDDSIVMINHIITGNKLLGAEIQAMWAVAYFDKRITLPSIKEREKDIARWIAYSRRRYLSNGQLGHAINFESITYTDLLLKEMGLSAHKKGWWKQHFEPFWPRDLGMAWAEYLGKSKEDRIGGKTASENQPRLN